MGWRRSLLVGSLMLMPLAALAEESAGQWFQKMLAASRQTSFQGQSVLVSDGKVTALTIYHAPVDDEVWERVVHMSGEPAEVLRKGSVVSCLHPGTRSRIDMGRTPIGKLSALEESAQSISRYYRFTRAGIERVAGHQGVRIDVVPLDAHRFGYSLWLDDKTGVLLKSQTNPAEGEPLETFEFVALNIGAPLPASAFDPAPELKDGAVQDDPPKDGTLAASEAGSSSPPALVSRWQATWLPEGFRPATQAVTQTGKAGRSAQVFTDGLAAFTVFFEPDSIDRKQTTRTHGATVAVNRILPDGGGLVTVVGEIPPATASKIADNVKRLAPAR